MYIKISQDDMNGIYNFYDELFMMNYHLPNFKSGNGEIYIDLDTIHKDVKPLLIHKGFKIETFFYDPKTLP